MSASTENKKYNKNFLSQVIYKVNFVAVDSINAESAKELKKKLGENYTTVSDIKQRGLIIEGSGIEFTTRHDSNTIWRIDSEANDYAIELEKSSFAVTCSKYTDFDAFKVVIESANKAFFEMFPVIDKVERLGLRYINNINLGNGSPEESLNWDELISEKLVSELSFIDDKKTIRRSMHSLAIAFDGETQINFNFGVFNNLFPSEVINKEFILDFDAFNTFTMQRDSVIALLVKYNEVITELFERSIKDGLREAMDGH